MEPVFRERIPSLEELERLSGGVTVKLRTVTSPITIAALTALAIPVCLAAQESQSAVQKSEAPHHRYKLIDVGTFGGPDSYFIFGVGVNGRGQAAGAAATPTSDPFYPICIFPDCFVGHTFQWQDGVATDLGALPGNNNSGVGGMNSRGTVAGVSENGLVDPVINFPDLEPVVWKDGHIIDLGTFGGNFGQANAINDRGQVVGFATNTISTPVSIAAFGCDVDLAVPTQTRAFIWEGGSIQDLGTLGGTDSCAVLINQHGQVAGYSFTDSSSNPPVHPFLWHHGTMRDLGTLGGTFALTFALNNRGEVAGLSFLAGDSVCHPFLWRRGELSDLGTLGGDTGIAESLNDAGDVVGEADLPGASGPCFNGPQAHHAFRWKHGVMTDLGTQDGDPCSHALSINSGGQVVGGSSDCTTFLHAFLWEDGGPMVDLNSFVTPSSNLILTVATLISDRGEIAVQGVLPNGDTHAFLLIPCEGDRSDDEGCEDAKSGASYANHVAPPAIAARSSTMLGDLRVRVRPRGMLDRFRGHWTQP
jgi:probable HAF family extracellular repeat protein